MDSLLLIPASMLDLCGRILSRASDHLLCGVLERCYPDALRLIAGIT